MKKKKLIILSSICLLIIFICILLINDKSNAKVLEDNAEKTKEDTNNKVSGMYAIMLETEAGSGSYEPSTSSLWPGSGYIYNETLSRCENGGELTWHEDTRTVSLKTSGSDKCYLYFDAIKPPDVTVATNNSNNYTPATPATLSCSGATAEYNQKYGRIEISQINKYTNCSLTYQAPSSKQYLNTYITTLAGQTQGDGQVVNENGYRYEGKNPNNYIWFNNELWRIIGVFDETSHGVGGQDLVKIIRANSIGGIAFDKSGTNNWAESSLMNLLNGAYLNSENGTGGEYCYGYSTSVPSNCDYTESGIKDTYRPMIENVTWYLGGHSTNSIAVDAIYGYERGTTVYSGRPTTWTGYIGLMYPSDYGYSVLASSCARTTNLSGYATSACSGQTWLWGPSMEWLITPSSSSPSNSFFIHYYAYLAYNGGPTLSAAIRPTLYLDSSVYVIDGNGSISDPYIIGM